MARIENCVLLVLLSISGCATSPVSNSEALHVEQNKVYSTSFTQYSPSKVKVTIKRDSGFMGSACSTRVYLDGIPLTDLNPKEKIIVFLDKDTFIISAQPNGLCAGGLAEVEADLRNGKEASFRIGSGQSGEVSIHKTAF